MADFVQNMADLNSRFERVSLDSQKLQQVHHHSRYLFLIILRILLTIVVLFLRAEIRRNYLFLA